MRWQVKAGVQKVLSGLPAGASLNYQLQRHVTKALPASDTQLDLHVQEACTHIEVMDRHFGHVAVADARCFEFGAGWDLIGPLAFHALGVRHQIVVDIRPNLRWELVNHTIEQFARHHDRLERLTGRELHPLGTADVASVGELKERFGIDYRAPADARATGLPDESVDFVSSTFTLEHIPREDIARILTETRRILAPTGLTSNSVDVQDHYSFHDSSITAFNFLALPDRRWALINSSLHFQNRMRARDYVGLAEQAGLRVIEATSAPPTEADLDAVRALDLAPRFRTGYTDEELATREVLVVARPAAAAH